MRSELSNQFLQFFHANPVLIPAAYIAGALIVTAILLPIIMPERR